MSSFPFPPPSSPSFLPSTSNPDEIKQAQLGFLLASTPTPRKFLVDSIASSASEPANASTPSAPPSPTLPSTPPRELRHDVLGVMVDVDIPDSDQLEDPQETLEAVSEQVSSYRHV